MPPKAKFTKKEIADVALEIYKTEGIEGLTSRNLGKKLGSSACPIFTVFSNMEEVEEAMLESAKELYKSYIKKGLSQDIPFRGVGEEYVMFALDEPKLFQLLFMNQLENVPSFHKALPILDNSYESILQSIMLNFNLDKKTAERLYKHLWIYTHGIACLCATKTCSFEAPEIIEMITEVFLSLLKDVREKN